MNTTKNTFVEKKMRKLNLENYTVSVEVQGAMQLVPYQFKKVLTSILTHVNLGLTAPELLEASELSDKIEKGTTEVSLTEEEYQLIVETFKRFRGFSASDTKMVKRVWECPMEE